MSATDTTGLTTTERIDRLEVTLAHIEQMVDRLTTLAVANAGAATELFTDPEDD